MLLLAQRQDRPNQPLSDLRGLLRFANESRFIRRYAGRTGRTGEIDARLADQLVRAAGFRNIVAHAYGTLDMARVHEAAMRGPDDLRIFLARVRDRGQAS